MLCRVLGVSRSGYYAWKARQAQPRGRAAQDLELVAEINRIHAEFRYYGSPRVHREMLARRQQVGRHRVARLMRDHGIRAPAMQNQVTAAGGAPVATAGDH